MNLWILTHSFCSSDSVALPSLFYFWSLNWPTMTETKRFITKKVVTKMKMMKRRAMAFDAFFSGARSYSSCESMAANMMSGQVSRVDTSKKVVIEAKTLL